MKNIKICVRIVSALCVAVAGAVFTLFAVVVCSNLLFVACTIKAKPGPLPTAPSFDGNVQNSGLLRFEGGFGIVTSEAVARYDELIQRYGTNKDMVPVLVKDFGVSSEPGSTNEFRMTKDALVKFSTMQRWLRDGK